MTHDSADKTVICDSHVHVFHPERFPYQANRRFTPGSAPVEALIAHLDRLGARHVVLVQPSVYGSDHGCLLDSLLRLKASGISARGISVIGHATTPTEIQALDRSGVRGARLNLVVDGIQDRQAAMQQLRRIDLLIPRHWHIQLHIPLGILNEISEVLLATHRHYVIDHIGLPTVSAGTTSIEWRGLLQLLKTGRFSAKLSAPYLSSTSSSNWRSLRPYIASMATIASNALVWGSNWPHTQGTARKTDTALERVEPFRHEDDLAWLHVCKDWLQALEVDPHRIHFNAQRLYEFDSSAREAG